MKRIKHFPGREQGVALVTVILIVTLATVAAVAMTSRQQLDIRRAGNILNHEQAQLYLLGAEDWATYILVRDKKDTDTDKLSDDWAKVLPPIPVSGGQITGCIVDLQARYNLNNLLLGADRKEELARFRRLLEALELNPQLANAVLDWLDADEELSLPGGAEDNAYLGLEHPYRAANRLMVSPSELLRINGFSYEAYQKLAPHVSTLPDYTEINVNTAHAPVLMMLAKDLSLTEAIKLGGLEKTGCGEEGGGDYDKVSDFMKQEELAGRKISNKGLGVTSKYFLVNAQALIGRSESQLLSVLIREDDGKISVLMRTRGEL